MPSPATTERYQHHRFPAAIMSHGVWLYSRFPLRSRDGHELLCEHGIAVSHDALRPWGRKYGQDDAPPLRHRRPQPGDTGHRQEMRKRFESWAAITGTKGAAEEIGKG